MEIFKRLLLPISSEFFPENAVRRIAELAGKFDSEVLIVYIIEQKTIEKMEHVAEIFLTDEQRKEIEKEIVEQSKMLAGEIIFKNVKPMINNFEERITFGEFSEEVKKISEEQKTTCVITGYEKGCLLRYRLFENMNIPVWVEMKKSKKHVLGVCTNLAPNKRVPSLTLELAECFGYVPHLLYVVDKEEKVEVDEEGRKTERKLSELLEKAEEFLDKYKGKMHTHFSEGILEEEIIKYSKEIDPDVIIIGREMKKRKIFCREMKREIVDKLENSLLFLN